MHSRTLLVAAVAAASAVLAAAEPARPKIYFPRAIKRQYTNTTITSKPVLAPAEETPLTQAPQSTKRDTFSELLESLTNAPVTSPEIGAKPQSEEPSGTESGDGVTTVVIHSTIVVAPDTPTSTDPPPPPTTTPDAAVAGSSSTGGVPDVIVQPTTSSDPVVVSSSVAPDSSLSAEAVVTSAPEVPTTSSGILLAPTGIVTSSKADDLLAPLESIISSIVAPLTSILSPPNTTEVVVLPTSTIIPDLPLTSLTLPPVIPTTSAPPPVVNETTTDLPPPTTVVPPPETTTDVPPPVTTTDVPPPLTTTDVPPPLTTTDLPPPPPGNTTTEVPPPPVTTTELPPPPPLTTTDVPPPLSLTNSTNPPPATSSFVLPPETTEPPPLGPQSTATSIGVLSTQAATEPWLPTTILQQPSTTTLGTPGLAPTSSASLPSTLPKAILPDSTGADTVQPDDSTLIQVGFLYSENYEFVSTHPQAAAQIFMYLPIALSNAGGFDSSKAVMHSLTPLNTVQTLGYITTLAKVYYPTALVEALRMDIKIPTSEFYNFPDEIVYNLTSQVNPAIDILTGTLDGVPNTTGGGGTTSTTAPPSTNDIFGDPPAEGGSQNAAQKGMTAGLTTAAIAVAGAYGAAMFIIARRYKRRKQAHQRTSSVTNPSEMRYAATGSPALMGGALLSRDFSAYGVAGGRDSHRSGGSGMGNSGRTAYISAPVAAENSLGWN